LSSIADGPGDEALAIDESLIDIVESGLASRSDIVALRWQPLVLTVTIVSMVVGGTLAPAAHIDRLADHALADQER